MWWTNGGIFMKDSYIVDKKTGQITGEVKEGDRLTRKQSIMALKLMQEKENATEPFGQDVFYKGYTNEIKAVLKELSTTERAFLFSIAPYINFEDCCLKYKNGVDVTTDDLIEICNLSRSTTFNTVNTLVDKDILYKGKNSKNRQYFVNPWLFCKGNRINKVLRTMFQNYRVRIYGGIKWKDLKEKE